jgi:maltose-binding protein MalE
MKLLRQLAMTALLILAVATLSHATDPMLNNASETKTVSETLVRGDVLMTEGEFYIVKDVTGHEVRLHVNKDTKADVKVKVGDKIEARVTPEGHATSLTLHIPQNGSAPTMPGMDSTPPQRSPERHVQ